MLQVCAHMLGSLMSANRVLEVLTTSDAAVVQQLTGLLRPQFFLAKDELLTLNEPPAAVLLLRSGCADVHHATQTHALGAMHEGEGIGAAECVLQVLLPLPTPSCAYAAPRGCVCPPPPILLSSRALQRRPTFWAFAHTNCDVLALHSSDLAATLAPLPELAARLTQQAEADLASQTQRHDAIFANLTDTHKLSWHTWRGDLQQDYQPPPETSFFKHPLLPSLISRTAARLGISGLTLARTSGRRSPAGRLSSRAMPLAAHCGLPAPFARAPTPFATQESGLARARHFAGWAFPGRLVSYQRGEAAIRGGGGGAPAPADFAGGPNHVE